MVVPPCLVRPDKIEAVTFTPLGGDGKTAVKVMTVFRGEDVVVEIRGNVKGVLEGNGAAEVEIEAGRNEGVEVEDEEAAQLFVVITIVRVPMVGIKLDQAQTL